MALPLIWALASFTGLTANSTLPMSEMQQIIERIHGDSLLMAVAAIAKGEKADLYLVGGTIRDFILGRGRQDYDFVLHQRDMTFIQKLRDGLKGYLFSLGRHEEQRVYRILVANETLDFNRIDGPTIEDDLRKRDFTINAVAYSLREDRFYSHPKAEGDIRERLIRMASPESFDRDPLRMMRGVRYLCTLRGFRMNERTKSVIREKSHLIRNTSVERTKMEMDSILLSPDPPSGMKQLAALGLLTEIVPELGVRDGGKPMDLLRVHGFSHYLRFLLCLQQWNGKEVDWQLHTEERLILSYAGLFAGMERMRAADYDRNAKKPVTPVSFQPLATEVMIRMKFSNRFKDLLKKILEHHVKLLNFSRSPMDSGDLRAIIHRIGTPLRLVIVFSLLDHAAGPGDARFHGDERLVQLCHRIKTLSEEGVTLSPPTLITGRDVIRMGFTPGPVVGHILRCVREKQIRGEIGNRKQALTFLRETFIKEEGSHVSS